MSGNVTVETTQNVDLELPLAPLGERILACLIDGFIRGVILIIMIFVIGWFVDMSTFNQSLFVVLMILALLPVLAYHLLFEIFNNGQSPGKRVFHLRVVSLQGDSVSIGAYVLRWLFRLVDFQLFSGLIALIAVAASEKSQRVGDMVAGTTVIKEQHQIQFHQLAYDEQKPAYIPVYPQASQLEPVHIELIKETLNNFQLTRAENHVTLLAEKTAIMMGVMYQEHPRKFLRTVVNDYSGASRNV
jgi:uncharacterized RDD family membrane protein YckC